MRRKKLYFILFLICYLLTGCQQAPDEVLDRMEISGKGGQMREQECKYCSVEELRWATLDDLTYQPTNLILPDKVDFSEVEAVEMLTFKRYEDYMEKKDEIAAVFGIENPKWKLVDGQGTWIETENNASKEYLAVDENGEVSYISGNIYDNLNNGEWPSTVRRIYLNRETCPELECSLNGTTIQLSEQINWTQDWIEHCELLNDEFSYKLRTVYVKEKQNRDNRVAMLFQRMYKGIGLDYIGVSLGGLDDIGLVRAGSSVCVELDEADKLSYFLDNTKVYVADSKDIEQVVDLESAVRIVEMTLAGYTKLKIAEVRLEYVLYPQKEKNNQEDNTSYREGGLMEGIPVYSFWIELETKDEPDFGISEANEYVFVNVSMIDGSVTTNFEEQNFHGQ